VVTVGLATFFAGRHFDGILHIAISSVITRNIEGRRRFARLFARILVCALSLAGGEVHFIESVLRFLTVGKLIEPVEHSFTLVAACRGVLTISMATSLAGGHFDRVLQPAIRIIMTRNIEGWIVIARVLARILCRFISIASMIAPENVEFSLKIFFPHEIHTFLW
jgi:hypothetical protein